MLDKIYSVARVLALLVAIVGAFVTIPSIEIMLLALGGIAGIGIDKSEQTRMFLIALVLLAGSAALSVIPTAGPYLSAIFSNIGLATIGGSIVAIAISIVLRIKSDWVKAA